MKIYLFSFEFLIIRLLPFLLTFNFLNAQHNVHDVIIKGEMRKVMWQGQLEGVVELDTIVPKKHLYGLGPLEYLKGEILVMDGIFYQSKVNTAKAQEVERNTSLKAPFFGYSHIPEWNEQLLPDSVVSIGQLESYINHLTASREEAFLFKMIGTVDSAIIHVVNLPEGSIVSNPDEAHQGQISYPLSGKQYEILGFFSRQHKTIFTHHDTFLHMHLITNDKKMMGHVDALFLSKGGRLYLPFK